MDKLKIKEEAIKGVSKYSSKGELLENIRTSIMVNKIFMFLFSDFTRILTIAGVATLVTFLLGKFSFFNVSLSFILAVPLSLLCKKLFPDDTYEELKYGIEVLRDIRDDKIDITEE